MDDLSIRTSEGRGRGVFAERDFGPKELIERAPAIVLPGEQFDLVRGTIVAHYFFRWVEGSPVAAIALGYGSLYNHSREPNALYIHRVEQNEIWFVARELIRKDEEILIRYSRPGDNRRLWFDEIETRVGA